MDWISPQARTGLTDVLDCTAAIFLNAKSSGTLVTPVLSSVSTTNPSFNIWGFPFTNWVNKPRKWIFAE